MEKSQLGKSGLMIAPLVLGGNVFGWTADEAMSFRSLRDSSQENTELKATSRKVFAAVAWVLAQPDIAESVKILDAASAEQ